MFDHIRVADRTLLFLNTLAVIAAFVPFYWLPIRGEIVRRDRGTS